LAHNKTIQKAAGSHTLRPRLATDTLFLLPAGSLDLRGPLNDAIRLVERRQLMNTALWEKFVRVFTESPRLDSENGGWRGEYWGKMMRGGCLTFAYTQNQKLYDVLTAAVVAMLDAADPEDGRISSYAREKEFFGWDMWCRKYVMLGLEYYYDICRDKALQERILQALRRHADYIIAHIGRGEGKISITRTSNFWLGVNSSSILEPMVRLYSLTGEQRFLNFATYIVDNGGGEGENIFELAAKDELYPYQYKVIKAYELMSCFEGLLEYYRITGIEKWRRAAENFARRVCESEVSIIGSSGCWHELFDNTSVRQLNTTFHGTAQETCVTVTFIKFCLQLLCLTGDPRFADQIERSVYNALLGAINYDKVTVHGGLHFDSYSPLIMSARGRYVGGKQLLSDGSFYGCCACIGAAGTGSIPAAAVLLREDGVAINLYAPGTVATKTPNGAPLEISVKTNYPLDGAINLSLDTTDEQPFTLALRIPAWSGRTVLAVNGELQDARAGRYATIHRVWRCGDRVELFLDMRTRVLRPEDVMLKGSSLPDENAAHHVAFCRGPLVLARDSRLPGDFNAPVDPQVDSAGYATKVETSDAAPFPHLYGFKIQMADGSFLETVDYASAGHTWSAESLVSAWMPTKRYWETLDLSRPFYMMPACYLEGNIPGSPSTTHLAVSEGKITVPADTPLVLRAVHVDGNTCCLAVEGGQQIAISDEGEAILAKKGMVFTLLPQGQNRYCLQLPDGRLLYTPRKKGTLPLIAREDFPSPYNTFMLTNIEA